MRLSIIIPVLNSHEIVRRQLLHFEAMGLPDDVELVIIDDGSDPPLDIAAHHFSDQTDYSSSRGCGDSPYNFYIHQHTTNDTRPWTQPKARNIGAREARGKMLLFTDIDHILPLETIDFASASPYGYGRFRRELGVLNEDGVFTQDREVLAKYGRPKTAGLRVGCHTLSMFVRRQVFEETGGFPEDRDHYPTHDDGHMKRRLKRLTKAERATKCPDDLRPDIYVFPNGRFCGDRNHNPMGLFHSLQR